RGRRVFFVKSPIDEWGVFACMDIPSGREVIPYIGEKVSPPVANYREQQYSRKGIKDTYLFALSKNSTIDATRKGNIACLINHSCDPNCIVKGITYHGKR
ncbi:hypothetical protein B0H10DRAFT_1686633, partial [Mycena sp. CBHHK59/15]